MKLNKYIIKNCEQIHSSDNFCWSKNIPCQDCTDCVMKQIVEKCKKTLSINKGSENEFVLGKMTFAEFILKDIDIQEGE